MSENSLQVAIQQKDFSQIEKLIAADTPGYKSLRSYEQDALIQTALRNKAFSLLLKMVDLGLLTVDLFEIDRWMGSFLYTVLLYTPFEKNPAGFRNPRPTNTVADPEAIDAGSLLFFRELTEKIENIDETVENQTLLAHAISQNMPIPILQLIVDAGCPADTYDYSDNTLLFGRLTPEVGRWLVEQGLDVNHKNKGGITPLERAIDSGNQNLVQILLDNGADIAHETKEGYSMFRFALVDKVDYPLFDLLCNYGQPDFHQMSKTGSSLLYDYVEHLHSSGEQQLTYLRKLLEMGADVQQMNTTMYGQKRTVLDAALAKDFAVFELLLNYYTGDINQSDDQGNTLLHRVCVFDLNHDQMKAKELYRKVKHLLTQGADVSLRNTQDKTAMDLAVEDNLKDKTVALLLKGQ